MVCGTTLEVAAACIKSALGEEGLDAVFEALSIAMGYTKDTLRHGEKQLVFQVMCAIDAVS